ncbi:MAG: zinc-ribbon domain-containing protein [Desulfosoma sp.]
MKITCEQCHTSLSLPEEKIPSGKSFRVQCPRCRNTILVRGAVEQSSSTLAQAQEDLPEVDTGYDDAFLDILEKDVRAALVCVEPQRQPVLIQGLKDMGFQTYVEDDPDRTVRRLRQGGYEVLVLEEPVNERDRRHVIVDFLKTLPMAQRRNLFVCLLSPWDRTMDSMAAFRKEADLIIHTNDLPRMQPVLQSEMKKARSFYRIFKEALEERGQL